MHGYEFLVDSREKLDFKNRIRAHDIEFRETVLNADFVLRKLSPEVVDIVGVERKTVADLVHSIGQKYKTKGHYQPRLFEQARRMDHLFGIKYLVISGDLEKHIKKLFFSTKNRFKVHKPVIYGSLASIAVRYGINIFWLPDDNALIEFVYRVFVKISEGKLGRAKEAPKYTRFDGKQMLATIPGVTFPIAERVLKHFGSLWRVARAKTDDLEKVDGIGPSTSLEIYKLFHRKWK